MKIHIIQDENLKATLLQKWKIILKFIWFKIIFKIDSTTLNIVMQHDPTVEQFFDIYMREESDFVRKIIDPFLSGIWAGNISELSAKSTLHGMLTSLRDKRISTFSSSQPRSKRVKRYLRYLRGWSAYVFKSGFQELTNKFASSFENNKIDVKYESTVSKIAETNEQYEVTYSTIQNQKKVEIKEKGFDFIISSLPAFTLKDILNNSFFKTNHKNIIIQLLDSVEYTDMVTLNFAYQQKYTFPNKCEGHVLTPSQYLKESKGVLGVLAMHNSYSQNGMYKDKVTCDFNIDQINPIRARFNFLRNHYINYWSLSYPKISTWVESDKVKNSSLFAIMIGGEHYKECTKLSDETLIENAEEFMARTYGITDPPEFVTLKRAYNWIPQYTSGHIDRMSILLSIFEKDLPRFRITGNYIDGSGIPHIIHYSKKEVLKIAELARLNQGN